MQQGHRRYLAAEAAAGAAFSGVLSVVFVFLIFGGSPRVAMTGSHGLIVDAVPEGFMIALMATLVPTMLTRRRLARGAVAPRPTSPRLPRPALARALLFAVIGAGVSVALAALLAATGVTGIAFRTMVIAKAAYGAALGALVAAIAAAVALDPAR